MRIHKPEAEKRSRRFTIPLTVQEMNSYRAAAAFFGLDMAEWARRRLTPGARTDQRKADSARAKDYRPEPDPAK